MPLNRYARSRIIRKEGKGMTTTSTSARLIFEGVKSGVIATQVVVLSEGQRLDLVAANYYGDAEYWWVIAAASGIGWQCQAPAGTRLRLPTSIEQIQALVGE